MRGTEEAPNFMLGSGAQKRLSGGNDVLAKI